MTPADLLTMIERDGARLVLTPSGRLQITGADVDRWLPVLGQYEAQLVEALKASADTDTDTVEAGR